MPIVTSKEMFKKAYEGVAKIHFDDVHFRKDIGRKKETI